MMMIRAFYKILLFFFISLIWISCIGNKGAKIRTDTVEKPSVALRNQTTHEKNRELFFDAGEYNFVEKNHNDGGTVEASKDRVFIEIKSKPTKKHDCKQGQDKVNTFQKRSFQSSSQVIPQFHATDLDSYFSEARYHFLRRYLRWGRCFRALKLRKKLAKFSRSLDRAFYVLLGRCYIRRHRYSEAHKIFQRLQKDNYLLKDYVEYWDATLWEREKKFKKAHKAYLKIDKSSLFYRSAYFRVIHYLFRKKRYRKVLKLLKKGGFLRKRDAKAWLLAAKSLLRLEGKKEHQLAMSWLRKIWVKKPASGEAQSVRRLRWRRKNRFNVSIVEKIERATRLNRVYAYRAAIRTLYRVKVTSKISQKWRCFFYYAKGFAWFRRRIYRRSVRSFLKARDECKSHPHKAVRILYRLSQAYRRRGMWRKGLPYLRELIKLFPKHFLADDAMFMLASLLERRRSGIDEAKKIYAKIQERYPHGDMVVMSLWRLAYRDYKHRQYQIAIKKFHAIFSQYPKSRHAPAALYFSARAWQRLRYRLRGRKLRSEARFKAKSLYQQLIRHYHLHYYSFMATARLAKLLHQRWYLKKFHLMRKKEIVKKSRYHRKSKQKKRKRRRRYKRKKRYKRRRWKRLVLEWKPLPKRSISSKDLVFLFDGKRASFMRHIRYKRGLELYRLGLKDYASLEWLRLRNCRIFPAPKGIPRRWRHRYCSVRGNRGAELLALHFNRAKQFHMADRMFRWEGRLPGKLSFNKKTLRLWYLAYPRPFYKLVNEASKRDKVPMALIYGLMREESTFNPNIQSWANAYGLMQLLLPTARSVSSKLFPKHKIQASELFNPAFNIPLGVRFLSHRLKQFHQHLAPTIGSYNAGPRLVKKWIKSYGVLPLDEWIEAISIRQTRRYIKRVLQSYAIYSFLYSEDKRYSGQLVKFQPWWRPRNLIK